MFVLFMVLFSCTNSIDSNKISEFPVVNARLVDSNSSRGVFYVDGKTFSGTIYWLYQNEIDTVRVKRYINGKKHGEWKKYYPNGRVEEVRYYLNGKKEGRQTRYYPNGNLRFVMNFKNDLYEGNAKTWTPNGMLIKDQNYHLGKEDGVQKVWYDNGKIKANYVIKEGRRFGLLGTKNCINVSDEIF